jgi:cytochrome c biogenesis protein CcdA
MTILSLIIVLVVVGALMYVINAVIPMDQKYKTVINVVVIVLLLIWLAGVFLHGVPFLSHRV